MNAAQISLHSSLSNQQFNQATLQKRSSPQEAAESSGPVDWSDAPHPNAPQPMSRWERLKDRVMYG